MKLSQIPLYLSTLLDSCGNSNGLWLVASFLGDAHHFNASFWSAAANVFKPRSKMRLHALNTRSNSGSSGSGLRANWNVLTKPCWDWLNTSFHLVCCNHESISTAGTSFNALNRRSRASAFQFSISWTIWSSTSSWLCSPPLPSSALGPAPSDSSPASWIAALRACRSCWACWLSSTVQYRSFPSWNHDCNWTGSNNSSSAALFLLWTLFACFQALPWSRVLNGHSRHQNPPATRTMGCGANPSAGNLTVK